MLLPVGFAALMTAARLVQPSVPTALSYALTAAMAACAALGALALVLPPGFKLSPGGLAASSGLRTRRWSWASVQNFRAVSFLGQNCIGFDRAGGLSESVERSGLAQKMTGADILLPADLEIDVQDACALLNSARERWAAAPGRLVRPIRATTAKPGAGVSVLALAMTALAGRLGRRAYWVGLGGLSIVTGLVALVAQSATDAIVVFSIGWLMLTQGRLRDLGRSPRWAMLSPVAPLVALGFGFSLLGGNVGGFAVAGLVLVAEVIALGVVVGSADANRFGPPPGKTATALATETGQLFD